jgi:hypothetical protein
MRRLNPLKGKLNLFPHLRRGPRDRGVVSQLTFEFQTVLLRCQKFLAERLLIFCANAQLLGSRGISHRGRSVCVPDAKSQT